MHGVPREHGLVRHPCRGFEGHGGARALAAALLRSWCMLRRAPLDQPQPRAVVSNEIDADRSGQKESGRIIRSDIGTREGGRQIPGRIMSSGAAFVSCRPMTDSAEPYGRDHGCAPLCVRTCGRARVREDEAACSACIVREDEGAAVIRT